MTINNKILPPGKTELGAHYDGKGVHFAIYSANASQVTLCLFDEQGKTETARYDLQLAQDGIWTGFLENAQPGTVYAYRLNGPYDPENGHRFNFQKVLLDPYAREIVGEFEGSTDFYDDNAVDTATKALKAKVIHETYDWQGDRQISISIQNMILYEAHVKGLTKLHPDIPPEIRGTYAGVSHHVMLDYLENLGITSMSFLPIQSYVDEAWLSAKGLTNYWGYSPIGYFCPSARYWSRRQGTTPISEFRDMVKSLHQRGIEVILDVVYNHTAEGGKNGSMISFRGIDNATYYRLDPHHKSHYVNYSGCGNTLNINNPVVLNLVLDSLRFWVQEMHVDGFRFDLAPILGREDVYFSKEAPFFKAMEADPVLSGVKKIAEPWDLGPNGYQLGKFPKNWLEWNDYYRDRMRAFWLKSETTRGEATHALAGSSRIFQYNKGNPFLSVNFITAHDGFTLTDLVSYSEKHNENNKEDNRDGHSHNYSINCGIEGPTNNPDIQHLRRQFKRSLMAMLLLSLGTPMILAGDEIGHTQKGNNNAYCQDNEVTWINWQKKDEDFLDYVKKLIRIRKTSPSISLIKWYDNQPTDITISWLMSDGTPVKGNLWDQNEGSMGVLIQSVNRMRKGIFLLNATNQKIQFNLPEGQWKVLLDSQGSTKEGDVLISHIFLQPHTVLLAMFSVEKSFR